MKKVLITGGNGDISKAVIRRLELCGGFEIRAPGRQELDVTRIDSVEAYVEGYVPDILINNAGYVTPQSIRSGEIETYRREIDVNLFGVFNCAAAVLRRNGGAQILNIGSSAATKVHGTWSGYCAAKAAVVMATRCWAEEGVNAVCLSPGRTATKMRKELFPAENPETLLKPDDFAVIVLQAIQGRYPPGSHVNVNVQNVEELKDA